jgi:hypothetical protein
MARQALQPRGAWKALTAQIEPQLFLMRPGFAISCVGHVAMLTIGLMFAGANPFASAPADAITVELVSPNEVETGLSEPEAAPAAAQDNAPSLDPAASTQQPQPTASTQQPPPASSPSTLPAASTLDQRTMRQASAPTQALPSSLSSTSLPWFQPLPEPAPPTETHEFNPGDVFAMPLTLPGGAVGYESPGEATEKPNITDEVIAAFRKHLKTCSILPAGVGAGARVTLRILLNPDGTLVKSPENPHAVGQVTGVSVGSGDLFMAAMAAVRKCQPYKMLPPDQYEEWKMFDVTFTGANFGGG